MAGFGIRAAFDLGRKSLRAQLAGLNVTGNNIANVNTKGYSRQEVSLVTDTTIKTTEGIFGTGVKLDGIRRIRDRLVDRQLRNELHTKSKNEILERILSQIETTINEPSDTGIRSLLSRFFDNFHNLANDPESAVTRINLKESANLLIEAFHRIDKQLRVLSDDVNFELQKSVEKLNSLTQTVAELNAQILSLEAGTNDTANELRDQRDNALDEISELLDIFALEKPNGIVDVAASEQTLVTSRFATSLEVVTRSQNGNLASDIITSEKEDVLKVRNGKLFGLLEARNEIIPNFRELFDTLANELISRVNNIHKVGVGLQGNALKIPKDNDFFSGNSALTIELSNAVNDNVNNIVAARRVDTLLEDGTIQTTGSPGDNRVAIELANLKQELILNKGTQSLIDFFTSIVSKVGIDAQKASVNVLNEELLIRQFQNLRDSTSGVSLDEEFVSLIKFQRGFQAGARIITTVDEMFLTLINM